MTLAWRNSHDNDRTLEDGARRSSSEEAAEAVLPESTERPPTLAQAKRRAPLTALVSPGGQEDGTEAGTDVKASAEEGGQEAGAGSGTRLPRTFRGRKRNGTRGSGVSARRIRTRFRSRRRSARRPTLFPEDRARESATPFETRKTTGGRRGRGGVRGASRKGGRGKQRGYRVSRAGDQGRRTPRPKHGLFGSGALRSQLATQRRQRSYDGRRLLRRRRMGKPRLARTVRTRPPRAPPRPGRPGPNRRVRHESDKRRKESEQRIVEKRERFVSQGCPQREDRGGHDAVRDAKRRPPATLAGTAARMARPRRR